METTNLLDLRQFFSVCQQLVLEAGKILRQAHEAGDIVVHRKPSGEAYTDYDLKIQTLYVTAFRKFWPNMKIIGEETQDYPGPIDFDYESLRTDLIQSHVLDGLEKAYIDLNQAILWIDPIDGTSHFVKGRMNWVTTLLGISINGSAKVGVVGRFYDPVENEENKYSWSARCYFGYADYPRLFMIEYEDGKGVKEVIPPVREEKEKLTCAILYFDKPKRTEPIEKCCDIVKIGGAAEFSIVNGLSDFYVYQGLGYMKWDLCAGEALLRCIGGILTDPAGNEFVYEENEVTWDCSNGMLACRSRKILEKALEIVPKKTEETPAKQ